MYIIFFRMEVTETPSFVWASLRTVFSSFFAVGVKLIFVAVFVIIILYFTRRFVKYFQQSIVEHNAYEENAVSFSNVIGDVFMYLVLVCSACIGLSFAWFTSVYVFLWATFATWYAFKELFQNLISWILIMTTKEFVLGDLIEVYVDDVVYFWRIDTITIRYMVVRKLDMTRVIIPNRLLTRVPVMTFSAEENVRLQTTFSLLPSSPMQKIIPLMKKAISDLESITEKDFTLVTIDGFKDWYIQVTAYFYFDPTQWKMRFRIISEVNVALSELFRANNIFFAYPHQAKTFDKNDHGLSNLVEQYVQRV